MRKMRRLCFVIIILAFNCACLKADQFGWNMLVLRLQLDINNVRSELETERRFRIELQSIVHQLQEHILRSNHTKSLDETDVLRADLKAQQNIIEQLRKDVDYANNQNQIAKNDNIRLQNEINDLRHNIIVHKNTFSNEKQNRKQIENQVHDLRSKLEALRLDLRNASDRQVNELMLLKSSTEKSLTSLRSDLHHMESKQNKFNSSASDAKRQMDAYIEGVSNEVCPLNQRFVDDCQLQGVNKSTCCLGGALRSLQETLRVKDLKLSEFEKKQDLRISFSARVSPSIENINPFDTIVFSDVINNEGRAYNPNNGKFVAPVRGTYVFFSHILGESRRLETALMINENVELLLYSADTRYFAPGSNMLVIGMDKGDTARMVKYDRWGDRPFYIHNRWSTFSGFLLSVG